MGRIGAAASALASSAPEKGGMGTKLADEESVPGFTAYTILTASKKHEVPFVRLIGCAVRFVVLAVLGCALVLGYAGAVRAEEPAKQDAVPPAALEPGAVAMPAFNP